MSAIAKNCATDVRVQTHRTPRGRVQTCIEAMATREKTSSYVQVNINVECRRIFVNVYSVGDGLHQHTLPWSSAFPAEPTLGEMIAAAEALARGEWHKLFPEDT